MANNIITSIEGRSEDRKVFDYKTKGMMASIGKRTGITYRSARTFGLVDMAELLFDASSNVTKENKSIGRLDFGHVL